MAELYIITGSNGAGKSTAGPDYLPPHILQSQTIFDGDKLFLQKRNEFWRSGIESHKECRKLAWEIVEQTFEQLVEKSLSDQSDFAYEGHFTNEATWDIPRKFLKAGFSIHLLYFGLMDTALSELRVTDRAKEGGHFVDPQTVSDNYFGNLQKLNQHYEMFHTLQIIDTSESEHQVLATLELGTPKLALPAELLPVWFRTHLPSIVRRIADQGPKFA